MTLSDFRHITDELLSAYIDDEVTEQERAWIEAAIAQDEEIAWRLNSLRQTVNFLRELPELALPRSFTLTLDQLAPSQEKVAAGAPMYDPVGQEAVAIPAAPRLPRQVAPESTPGFWEQFAEGWRRFWQGGSPMLRNAAAVSFALLIFLTSGGQILNRALTQPVGMMATAPEAAPASSGGESANGANAGAAAASEADPAQAVAIAPTATEAASLQMQTAPAEEGATEGDTSAKAPVAEGDTGESSDAPVAESARVMEAPAEAASDAPAEESNATAARVAEDSSTDNANDAAVAASAAAVAEAAPVEESAPAEPAVAAAMAAPEAVQEEATQGDEMPPLVPNPLPGGGAGGRPQSGGGGGMGGGGPEGPIGGGSETNGLIPEQAYGFDVNPTEGEAAGTAEGEAGVTASVAATPPAADAAASSVADVAVTPAVDAVESPTAEADTAEAEGESALAVTASETATVAPTAQAVAAATEEVTSAATATPEAVALVAPGAITSSEIVEAVNLEGATPPTGITGNLPVIWVAQGTAFLLTIVLASLWWRSRTPRTNRSRR